MKVIVGLGNPTDKYAGTRHNMGFSVITQLSDIYNINMNEKKHKAVIGKGVIEGEKVILVMPMTFMNLSGESVRDILNFYKITMEDVIVVYDDICLDIGQLRIREKGSAGGHNGIKNIIQNTGTDTFVRVRVGVGEKPKDYDLADYVLSRFPKESLEDVRQGVKDACDAIAIILSDGVANAMNKYNGKKK